MMKFDMHDEPARDSARSDSTAPPWYAALRSLEESGVEVTGSESGAELSQMQASVEAFRRAAEALAGRPPLSGDAAERCRQVVPPRAVDETPRQYAERVNRMTERFRALTQGDRAR
jgi:hypothetical protein